MAAPLRDVSPANLEITPKTPVGKITEISVIYTDPTDSNKVHRFIVDYTSNTALKVGPEFEKRVADLVSAYLAIKDYYAKKDGGKEDSDLKNRTFEITTSAGNTEIIRHWNGKQEPKSLSDFIKAKEDKLKDDDEKDAKLAPFIENIKEISKRFESAKSKDHSDEEMRMSEDIEKPKKSKKSPRVSNEETIEHPKPADAKAPVKEPQLVVEAKLDKGVSLALMQGSIVDSKATFIADAANVDFDVHGFVTGLVMKAAGGNSDVSSGDTGWTAFDKVKKNDKGEKKFIKTGTEVLALAPNANSPLEKNGTKFVLHGAGPNFTGVDLSDKLEMEKQKGLLKEIYLNSLRKAVEIMPSQDITIGFPLISAGVFKGDMTTEEAANLSVKCAKEAIDEFINSKKGANKIKIEFYVPEGGSSKPVETLIKGLEKTSAAKVAAKPPKPPKKPAKLVSENVRPRGLIDRGEGDDLMETCFLNTSFQLLAHFSMYRDLFDKPLEVGDSQMPIEKRRKVHAEGKEIIDMVLAGTKIPKDKALEFLVAVYDCQNTSRETAKKHFREGGNAAELMTLITRILNPSGNDGRMYRLHETPKLNANASKEAIAKNEERKKKMENAASEQPCFEYVCNGGERSFEAIRPTITMNNVTFELEAIAMSEGGSGMPHLYPMIRKGNRYVAYDDFRPDSANGSGKTLEEIEKDNAQVNKTGNRYGWRSLYYVRKDDK